jgi:hypothetical protein
MSFSVLGAGQPSLGTALAGHFPPAVCYVLGAHVTDRPGRWPVSSKKHQSPAAHQIGCLELGPEFWVSLSDKILSRLWVALRSTPLHGFSFIPPTSSLMAHEKIARGRRPELGFAKMAHQSAP